MTVKTQGLIPNNGGKSLKKKKYYKEVAFNEPERYDDTKQTVCTFCGSFYHSVSNCKTRKKLYGD